ncbi:hypothetical protein IBE76_10050, partial [Francisella tularensis]|nr:hypothetical protein [Francisella tularensis]
IQSQALNERARSSGTKPADLIANDIMLPIAKANVVSFSIIEKETTLALAIGSIALHYIQSQALNERARSSGTKPADLIANDIMLPIAKANV